jgi:aromatic-L-amino-acid/L-tryptophan decarboxylase
MRRASALHLSERAPLPAIVFVAYASNATHGCIHKAMQMSGLGAARLRYIPTDGMHRMRIPELRAAIASDRQADLTPFVLMGNAGTVDIGAIDPLLDLSEIAAAESMWFHVDGAFGALAILAPDLAPRLKGIERADSIAFDFHK